MNDLKRIISGLNNPKSFEEILHFIETGEKEYRPSTPGRGLTRSTKSGIGADKSVYTVESVMTGKKQASIFVVPRDHYISVHPTQKPVRLLERLLMLVLPENKKKKDILVFDPFGGSFSTMVAVHNMGLQGISCEIDEEYFQDGLEFLRENTEQLRMEI